MRINLTCQPPWHARLVADRGFNFILRVNTIIAYTRVNVNRLQAALKKKKKSRIARKKEKKEEKS